MLCTKLIVAHLVLTSGVLAASASAQESEDYTNQDVMDVIEREMLLDDAVSSNDVDLSISEGVVTLTGSVDNLLEKERAARIAETVKGVRAVVDRLTIQPAAQRSDAELQTAATEALLRDPATDSYEVGVAVEDRGRAFLSGEVESFTERELCSTVVKGVDGVTEVVNRIEVSPAGERPDGEIAAEIRQALKWDVYVHAGLIDVEVRDGAAVLSGTVGSAAERRKARDLAWTSGVTSVDVSRLNVARWARDSDLRDTRYVVLPDDEVRSAIEDALERDPRVSAFHVDTSVVNGNVTLRGVVDNLKAKRAAARDASHTAGVLAVRNHLKVRPEIERSDEAIEADVREALLRDPYVNRFEVTVASFDGTVYLGGQVDSYFERGQADDLASRVNGVTDVVNTIAVADDSTYAAAPYVDTWSIYAFPWYLPHTGYSYVSDPMIELEIEDQLFWSPFVDADEVTVEVEDGVATLTGTVDSWMELGAARDNAYEGGATYVRNELEVAGGEDSAAN